MQAVAVPTGRLLEMRSFLEAVAFSRCTCTALTAEKTTNGEEALLCQFGDTRLCLGQSSDANKEEEANRIYLPCHTVAGSSSVQASMLAAMSLGWHLTDLFSSKSDNAVIALMVAPFCPLRAYLCSCPVPPSAAPASEGLLGQLLASWRKLGSTGNEPMVTLYQEVAADIRKARERGAETVRTGAGAGTGTGTDSAAPAAAILEREPISQPRAAASVSVCPPAVQTPVQPDTAPSNSGIACRGTAVPVPAVAALQQPTSNNRVPCPEDFAALPLPPFYAKLRTGSGRGTQYVPLPPNSKPIPFKNEYFEGHALLICRTEAEQHLLNPYRARFEGPKGHKYQFEVQVQGKFLKSTRNEDGCLYMGGEISKKMSLGMLTRGMCSTILKIGRAVCGAALHSSYGDNDNRELPHVGVPMWSGLDNIIVTRPPRGSCSPSYAERGDVIYIDELPRLGSVLKEDESSKKKRLSEYGSPEVDLEALYTMSFKTSNIDIRRWTLSNVPLLSGTDLHSFWGDASLRIGCWLVPPPLPGDKGANVLKTKAGPIALPKYHLQEIIQYIFSIDIQHISNIDIENDQESLNMLQLMHNDGNNSPRLGALSRTNSENTTTDSGVVGSVTRDRRNSVRRRNSAQGLATNMVSYTTIADETVPSSVSASVVAAEALSALNASDRHSAHSRQLSRTGGSFDYDEETGEDDTNDIILGMDEGDDGGDDDSYVSDDDGAEEKSEDGEGGTRIDEEDFEGTPIAAAGADSVGNALAEKAGADVVNIDQMTLINGRMTRLPPPVKMTYSQLMETQRQQLVQYYYQNTHVVAVMEFDDPRFLHTQRLTIGQKGRRTMYVFAVKEMAGNGSIRTSYALRTFQEWKSAFSVTYGYEKGSANTYSTEANAYAVHESRRIRSHGIGSDETPVSPLAIRCRNINYARISDTERRRQDLDNSYRTILLQKHLELHNQQAEHQREVDLAEKEGRSRPVTPAVKAKGSKGLFGGKLFGSKGDSGSGLYASQVQVSKVNKFLTSTPHHMDALLSKPGHGGGVGSRKLRTGISAFAFESYCCVQQGGFFWSQEYIGLTEDELVFIKPASRLGVSKRITLPLLALKEIRAVPDSELPFTIGTAKAFSVSTFSRVFLLLVKSSDLQGMWIETLHHTMQARRRALLYNNTDTGSVRHLDLMVRTKDFHLDSDQYVMNARSFLTGSLCASSHKETAWPQQDLSYFLKHPHLIVERLLKKLFRLVEVSADEDAEDSLSEQLWIDFLDGAALLQRADLSVYSASMEGIISGNRDTPDERTDNDSLLAMLLNLYHVMLLHAYLVLGLPDNKRKWADLRNNYCYEAFGDCFSIEQLENNIIRKGLLNSEAKNAYIMNNYVSSAQKGGGSTTIAYKDKSIGAGFSRLPGKLLGNSISGPGEVSEYSYGAAISVSDKDSFAFSQFTNKDMRLLFVLNTGHSFMPQHICIFSRVQLSSQLDSCTETFVHRCVQVGLITRGIDFAVDNTDSPVLVDSSLPTGISSPTHIFGEDFDDTVYISAVPGIDVFLKVIGKMKVLSTEDTDEGDVTPQQRTKRMQDVLHRKQQVQRFLNSNKGVDISAFENLSTGMKFSGERNFLAFILRHMRKDSELQRVFTAAVKARHPKTPPIKIRKAQFSAFHFLQEIKL